MRRSGRLAVVVIAGVLASALDGPLSGQSASGAPRGRVRLVDRSLADDRGPWLPLGASLFWALWGERHDPDRLDRNLAWLAERGVDYIRVLGMVGSESWADRRIDPHDKEYWPTVDRLFERLERHGLRAQVTIFADARAMMPRPEDRRAFVDAWAARAERHRTRIMLLEIANEYSQNGLDDVDELRALGRRLASRTSALVALSAASTSDACRVYARSAARIATVHYPRSDADDDPWRAVRAPWGWPGDYERTCRGRLPVAINNEPIGPQSSVQSDDDPLRLVMAWITTFVAGNAAYVLHTGAGIRGGGAADKAEGRSANFADVPNLDDVLAGIRRARRVLPRDLASWRRRPADDPAHPFTGLDRAARNGSIAAAYAATSGNRFVVVVLGLREELEIRARRAIDVDVHNPLREKPSRRVTLADREALSLSGSEALVLTGRAAER